MLEIEIDLAMRDWEEIPTNRIEDVCAEARKRAGEFMPSNGLIAQVWRDQLTEAKRPRMEVFRALPMPQRTEAEREAIRGMCRSIMEDLGPGTRPDGWAP